jgi:hypothetical protein
MVDMSTKEGLSEAEYLAVVERIQQAMCIEPFRPDVTDVVMLIGAWRVQQRENERLRAELEQALAFADHSKRGCCEWHILKRQAVDTAAD